jgi:hypothetical protein
MLSEGDRGAALRLPPQLTVFEGDGNVKPAPMSSVKCHLTAIRPHQLLDDGQAQA